MDVRLNTVLLLLKLPFITVAFAFIYDFAGKGVLDVLGEVIPK